MNALTFVLAAGHALLAAIWLGSMCYSVAVVQPRAARLLGAGRYEEFAVVLASGARWTVLGMCAALAVTGSGLAATEFSTDPVWITLIVAKTVLFGVTVAVFARVSWRLWPKRVFALPEELPGIHRAFRRVAYTLITLVGAQIVLGVAAHTFN